MLTQPPQHIEAPAYTFERNHLSPTQTTLLHQAFANQAEKIERCINNSLPKMFENLLSTHTTQTVSCRKDNRTFVIKLRHLQNDIQLLAQSQIGHGGFKIVKKVVLLSGPLLRAQPAPIYAYAKPRRRINAQNKLRKIEAALKKKCTETRIDRLKNEAIRLHAEIEQVEHNLVKEARISKKLSHIGNFLRMRTVTKQKDKNAIKGVLMEYCQSDLFDLIEESAYPLTAERFQTFCQIAYDICHAVDQMHTISPGFCHLDLKTGNILIQEKEGRLIPKIIDFGLTRKKNTPFSGPRGTLAYIAPEQFDSKVHTIVPSMDSWGLGLILLEMFYGVKKNIFHSNTSVSYFRTHFHTRAYYPKFLKLWYNLRKKIVKNLHSYPSIDPVIKHLLCLNPKKRMTPGQAAQMISETIKTF